MACNKLERKSTLELIPQKIIIFLLIKIFLSIELCRSALNYAHISKKMFKYVWRLIIIKKKKKSMMCVICTDTIQPSNMMKRLATKAECESCRKSGEYFHKACWNSWIKRKNACPLCNVELKSWTRNSLAGKIVVLVGSVIYRQVVGALWLPFRSFEILAGGESPFSQYVSFGTVALIANIYMFMGPQFLILMWSYGTHLMLFVTSLYLAYMNREPYLLICAAFAVFNGIVIKIAFTKVAEAVLRV